MGHLVGGFRFVIYPSYTKTLGAMIDEYHPVTVSCTKCGLSRLLTFDALQALADVKGRDYSLMNRRCRCKLKEGCDGWNRFFYSRHSAMCPLWDEATSWRWFGS